MDWVDVPDLVLVGLFVCVCVCVCVCVRLFYMIPCTWCKSFLGDELLESVRTTACRY